MTAAGGNWILPKESNKHIRIGATMAASFRYKLEKLSYLNQDLLANKGKETEFVKLPTIDKAKDKIAKAEGEDFDLNNVHIDKLRRMIFNRELHAKRREAEEKAAAELKKKIKKSMSHSYRRSEGTLVSGRSTMNRTFVENNRTASEDQKVTKI